MKPDISNPIQIEEALSKEALEQITALLWSYGESRNFDSALGNFTQEISLLPYRYARPDGCLLLATYKGEKAGCVAYQQLSPEICEMKRLYVDPLFRGKGLGKALVNRICLEAKKGGYQKMRLDTFGYYKAAINSYLKAGFYEIAPYQKYDMENVLFFEKLL